ncbi:hypothetical protein NV379_09110 [Paenibacillus sp. N1-5-1-14]|uniref:hypothetical protein n=1 Tax=Paenibacillus radicibacter TaxID=2972488 RepID=UPI002158C1C5|nr:hypothetical protein [Paenibacillus radicibacter]MCR8642819.1 hypothetical protein [Paenibacillus radicibacter]
MTLHKKFNVSVVLLLLLLTGFGLWQHLELRKAQNEINLHGAKMANQAAYHLKTIQRLLENSSGPRDWENPDKNRALLIRLTYTLDSLHALERTMSNLPDHFPYESRKTIGYIVNWYNEWFSKTLNILADPETLLENDKAHLYKFITPMSKVDFSFSDPGKDWDEAFELFDKLHKQLGYH